jgi:hypothetical protein
MAGIKRKTPDWRAFSKAMRTRLVVVSVVVFLLAVFLFGIMLGLFLGAHAVPLGKLLRCHHGMVSAFAIALWYLRDPDTPPDMPKDTSIKSVLLIGSGPIVIGQACEFDYSGSKLPAPSATKASRSR